MNVPLTVVVAVVVITETGSGAGLVLINDGSGGVYDGVVVVAMVIVRVVAMTLVVVEKLRRLMVIVLVCGGCVRGEMVCLLKFCYLPSLFLTSPKNHSCQEHKQLEV